MPFKTKIIAITGGSGSGKTTAAKMLLNKLSEENQLEDICIISQDDYYKDQSKNFKGDGSINFDHPDAIDFNLMEEHLKMLLSGESVNIPIYDFVTHSRKKETRLIAKKKYILII